MKAYLEIKLKDSFQVCFFVHRLKETSYYVIDERQML